MVIHDMLAGSYKAISGFVLHSFKSINRRVRLKFPVWHIKEETSKHAGIHWIALSYVKKLLREER